MRRRDRAPSRRSGRRSSGGNNLDPHRRAPARHRQAASVTPASKEWSATMATASTMSHKQRLRAALAGEPVDRPPISLWWHDFEREWSAEGMADATVEAYHTYDWDLVKLNPRATYYFEAWGSRYEPTGNSQPRLVTPALERFDSLGHLPDVDPVGGVFAEQLE